MATKILVSLTRRDRIESNESCSMNFNRVGVFHHWQATLLPHFTMGFSRKSSP